MQRVHLISIKKMSESTLANVLVRRFFVIPAFEIYGGVAGLYDLGPSATELRNNLLNLWRQHFIVAEDMLEVMCTNIVPEKVLQASGHVARFADVMVKDVKNGECFRADKLIEGHIEKKLKIEGNALDEEQQKILNSLLNSVDGASPETIKEIILSMNILSPSGNPLSDPFPFNLMFQTNIGPSSGSTVYLRPETAQGIFMNFKRGLEQAKQLPFAMAQIGTVFRNEISPRNSLLRVREFEQCEIEHFIDGTPESFRHPKINTVTWCCIEFFTAEDQLAGKTRGRKMSILHALHSNILAHETLAYFIGRTYLYLLKIGLDPARLRFRQHLPKQLAHYARDCWDCDCLLSCGWTEIVGIADRSAYDLQVHSKASGVDLTCFIKYHEPREVSYNICTLKMKECAKIFKKDINIVRSTIEALQGNDLEAFKATIQTTGTYTLCIPGENGEEEKKFEILANYVQFNSSTKLLHGETIVPHVIEPSFGVGRILYSILEHSFYTREQDDQRTVFRFKPYLVGCKAIVLPLIRNNELLSATCNILEKLRRSGISVKQDATGAPIGRRYARADEIGIPFALTIDFQTLEDGSVTIRERDSMSQVRVGSKQISQVINDLSSGKVQWSTVYKHFPHCEINDAE